MLEARIRAIELVVQKGRFPPPIEEQHGINADESAVGLKKLDSVAVKPDNLLEDGQIVQFQAWQVGGCKLRNAGDLIDLDAANPDIAGLRDQIEEFTLRFCNTFLTCVRHKNWLSRPFLLV